MHPQDGAVTSNGPSAPWPTPSGQGSGAEATGELMARIARGDTAAFSELYDAMAPRVYGLVRRVLRNPAQSEEVTASRYGARRGSVTSWVLTMAHRRAIDRVRSEQASTDREHVVAATSAEVAYDAVSEAATTRLESEQVRRCLGSLTELQRESVTLAYYGGYSYREVAELLDANLATVKARMRDGLIRMRDCLGVVITG
jgi:RNA polymerase sigma-70 factor, ECF subfamily